MNTIFIIDSHKLFARGLELLLASIPGDNAVTCFDNPGTATMNLLAGNSNPTLFIAEFLRRGPCGCGLIKQLRALCPQANVLSVSSFENQNDKAIAMEAGAAGFFDKSSSAEAMLDTVAQLLCSETLVSNLKNIDEISPEITLTTRQQEVLCLASKGYSNKEIARFLGLSPETIKSHLAAVFTRLGVLNRIEAMDFVRCNGILTTN
ncbi:MAG: response regulator transcription factor [Rhizobiaceae bacterium]